MNALKPCPFCGEMPEVEPNGDCYCDNYICPMAPDSYMPGDWNTRPIEDDLRKRIAELENEHNVWLIGASNAVKNLEARIAELEAEIDRLIEAGNALSNGIAEAEIPFYVLSEEILRLRTDWKLIVDSLKGG